MKRYLLALSILFSLNLVNGDYFYDSTLFAPSSEAFSIKDASRYSFPDSFGNIVLFSTCSPPTETTQFISLLKVNPQAESDSQIIWQYNSTEQYNITLDKTVLTSGSYGEIYATQWQEEEGFIIKIDGYGVLSWAHNISVPPSSEYSLSVQRVSNVVVDQQGRVFVIAQASDDDTIDSVIVIWRFSSSGTFELAVPLKQNGRTMVFQDLALYSSSASADGNIVLSIRYGLDDVATVLLSLNGDGDVQFTHRVDTTKGLAVPDDPLLITTDAESHVYFLRQKYSGSNLNMVLTKYYPNLTVEWISEAGTKVHERILNLIINSQGNPIIVAILPTRVSPRYVGIYELSGITGENITHTIYDDKQSGLVISSVSAAVISPSDGTMFVFGPSSKDNMAFFLKFVYSPAIAGSSVRDAIYHLFVSFLVLGLILLGIFGYK